MRTWCLFRWAADRPGRRRQLCCPFTLARSPRDSARVFIDLGVQFERQILNYVSLQQIEIDHAGQCSSIGSTSIADQILQALDPANRPNTAQ